MKIITKIIKEVNEGKKIFIRAVPSLTTLHSGTIIVFDYEGEEKVGMVILSIPQGRKNKSAVWKSKNTGNMLVNVIKIDRIISDVITLISENLKKHGVLYSKQFSGLKALVGRGYFRTYNIGKIRNLYKLYYINKER